MPWQPKVPSPTWRSFLHNQEVNVVILGTEFGERMRASFDRDLAASKPITLEEWERRPLGVTARPAGAYFPAYLDFVRRTLRRDYHEADLTEAGLAHDDDVVVYCRIGERSSHTWFVLQHLLGYPHVRNYDGSWTEWGNSVRVPIKRGDSP